MCVCVCVCLCECVCGLCLCVVVVAAAAAAPVVVVFSKIVRLGFSAPHTILGLYSYDANVIKHHLCIRPAITPTVV